MMRSIMNKNKEYLFWREVRRVAREECVIEAKDIDEATQKHNDGCANYEETNEIFSEINDEGTEELK